MISWRVPAAGREHYEHKECHRGAYVRAARRWLKDGDVDVGGREGEVCVEIGGLINVNVNEGVPSGDRWGRA